MNNSEADTFFSTKRTIRQLTRLANERAVNPPLELTAFYSQGAYHRSREARVKRAPQFTRNATAPRVKVAASLPPTSTGPTPTSRGRYERNRVARDFFGTTHKHRRRRNISQWARTERYGYAEFFVKTFLSAPLDPLTPAEIDALERSSTRYRRRIKRGSIRFVGVTEARAMEIAARALGGENVER